MDSMNDRRKGKTLRWLVMVVCAVVFIGSAVVFSTILLNVRREKNTFTELAKIANEGAAAETVAVVSGDSDGEEKEPFALPRYATLHEMNPDMAGWLKIDGTKMDYPVMHTPEDMQYYIHRDFYGKESASGTPFIGDNCDADSMSVLIYGHNMKNGTMFGELDEYEDEAYWQAHPIIQFDSLKEEREYEVFAAFRTRLLYEGEAGFRYYQYAGELEKEDFDEFVDQSLRASSIDTGIVPEYGDQILILSTCSYHTENGRFVVAARRVTE